MKKIILTASLLASILSLSQAQTETKPNRKLKFEEANFVSSYYSQTGNNAAVTGGIGSEKLTDIGGSFDIRFSFLDKKNRKNTLFLDATLERYSSASSDKIDPTTVSSASMTDVHFYPSLAWSRKNEETGNGFGLNLSLSTEYDYQSYGGGVNYNKTSKDKSSEFSAKLNIFFDTWKVILPVELRPLNYPSGAEGDSDGIDYKPRNTYNVALSYFKIVNPSLQLSFMLDPSYQEGLLSTPFHRVYFNDGSLRVEKLPGQRFKIPASIRANQFLGDKLILRSMYRFYTDNWNLNAHTVSLETVYKINPFFSVTPHYRFNSQSGIKQFAAYAEHYPSQEFYSSDFDLSKFQSHFAGLGFRVAPPSGIFGLRNWKTLELRYGYYHRSTGLNAHIVSMAIQIK